MTPEELRHAAEVLLAAADGKQIQKRIINDRKWFEEDSPDFDFNAFKFRIKPEPRECWVNFYTSKTGYAHSTKAEAQEQGEQGSCEPETIAIHMREVMDE